MKLGYKANVTLFVQQKLTLLDHSSTICLLIIIECHNFRKI